MAAQRASTCSQHAVTLCNLTRTLWGHCKHLLLGCSPAHSSTTRNTHACVAGDDYDQTHNLTLKTRDTAFGGQVSCLQVARLMATAARHPGDSENMVRCCQACISISLGLSRLLHGGLRS